MSRPLIFCILTLIVVVKVRTNPPKNYGNNVNLLSLATEYVRLHLVEELSRAGEMIKTREGREWLNSWYNKRTFIINEVLFYLSEDTHVFNYHQSWRKRLMNFQIYQMEYLKEITKYFDKRRDSPWPRFTFDPASSEVTFHLNQLEPTKINELDFADPIVNDIDVNYVLRFHRPLTDDEKSVIEKSELFMKSMRNDDAYQDTVNVFKHNAEEREIYRPLLKKYYVIDRKMIENLLKMRYDLMKESLKDKRTSYVSYQKALFHADRIISQLELFKLIGYYNGGIYDFYKTVPIRSRILIDDVEYRKYLNTDDVLFPGNILYGFINRYDDPAAHGMTFEENAKLIIGNRFKPMRELHDDMVQFGINTDGFVNRNLQDLPTIDALLNRFKTWTFWFSKSRFNAYQWFAYNHNLQDNLAINMIRPSRYRSSSIPTMMKQVKKVLSDAKKPSIINDFFKGSEFEKSHRLKNQLQRDGFWFAPLIKVLNINFHTVLIDNLIRYFDSVDRAGLSSRLWWKTSSSNSLKSHEQSFAQFITKKVNRVEKNKNNKFLGHLSAQKTKLIDTAISSIKGLYNLDTNLLIPEPDQRLITMDDANSDFHGPGFSGHRERNNPRYGTGDDVNFIPLNLKRQQSNIGYEADSTSSINNYKRKKHY